ncbi:MAG: SO_0444 family Cu/Zn efflux transporter [Gammaproteobacteria bacterium]|nr:SO_0444 family Cu/Zn efflux transporter [Gammaproteobacteria bacterium]
MLIDALTNIWLIFLDTAFWLLIGLLAAGLIKSFIAEDTMQRWVGGRGIGAILRAALFGAPLPLCSCGVLPTAIGLHRAGASKEATVSFLISTPETSIDSVAVTYALMGPLMAVFRPLAALVNAVGTGLLTTLVDDEAVPAKTGTTALKSCCTSKVKTMIEEMVDSSCCADKAETAEASCCSEKKQAEPGHSVPNKAMLVLSYAGAELLDDISRWMAFGIVLAGIMLTFIPPDWLAQWGAGLPAMLVMLVVGVPMYICAVASTPVAAGLLLAGVSPGAVLIFLLVGPATNIGSFALLKNELGLKVTLVYLAGLSVFSLMMGLLLEWLLAVQGWQINAVLGEAHTMLPDIVSWGSAFLLILLAIKPLRRALIPQLG